METKIPFDISKRAEIENGRYKVVTRFDRPVEILTYEAKGNKPIIARIGCAYEDIQRFNTRGFYIEKAQSSYDLFLIDTQEPKPTEFEEELYKLIKSEDYTKGDAERLLNLAREEYEKEFNAIRSEIREAGKAFGRAEVLRNLPKWEEECYGVTSSEDKSDFKYYVDSLYTFLHKYDCKTGRIQKISLKDLDKLPEEDEK